MPARNPKIRVVFAGGKINKSRDGFCGMTLDFIFAPQTDIAFVGAVGVDVKENSVSTYDIDDGINEGLPSSAIARKPMSWPKRASSARMATTTTRRSTRSGLITDSEPVADIRAAADSYGVRSSAMMFSMPAWLSRFTGKLYIQHPGKRLKVFAFYLASFPFSGPFYRVVGTVYGSL